jgi:hypothetical protein
LAAILKSRGSTFGDIVGTSISTATDGLTANNYTSAHAHSMTNTSRGLKYMRAVDSSTSMLYANSTQTAMADSFSGPVDTVDATPGDGVNITSTGTVILNDLGVFDLAGGITGNSITIPKLNPNITIITGTPFIDETRVNLTPDLKLAGKEVKKKDGLNKRRQA